MFSCILLSRTTWALPGQEPHVGARELSPILSDPAKAIVAISGFQTLESPSSRVKITVVLFAESR